MARIEIPLPEMEIDPKVAEIFQDLLNVLNEVLPEGITEADLLAKTSRINGFKTHGMSVTLMDVNKTVWATGRLPESPWVDAMGNVVYEPV